MRLVGMIAETFVRPGSGQALGVIDLPVARERATGYPYIAGSSLKGAFLQAVRDRLDKATVRTLFGFGPLSGDGEAPPDDAVELVPDETGQAAGRSAGRAGDVLFADARLLLLPVRRLNGPYAWATCPYVLERFARDCRRAGLAEPWPGGTVRQPEPRQAIAEKAGRLELEERVFTVAADGGPAHAAVAGALGRVIAGSPAAARLAGQLVVLRDEDFDWFCQYGLHVQARNSLDDEIKTSKALWYEETLPPDTVMYTLLSPRLPGADPVGTLLQAFAGAPYLQVGANETVGQGWFHLCGLDGSEAGGS